MRRKKRGKMGGGGFLKKKKKKEEIKTRRQPMAFTACATRSGSSQSSASGRPCLMSQKPQVRVQMSPIIKKVAVPAPQHSPMLGQPASSQTVCSDFLRINCCSCS